jgi:hypothetical protein
VTHDELVAAGYRTWTPSSADRYDLLYQKRVKDDRGTRYFVNVRFWRFSKYSTPERPVEDGWDAEARFDGRGGSRSFAVSTSVRHDTPAEVEAFFARVWDAMKPGYYEVNDDE